MMIIIILAFIKIITIKITIKWFIHHNNKNNSIIVIFFWMIKKMKCNNSIIISRNCLKIIRFPGYKDLVNNIIYKIFISSMIRRFKFKMVNRIKIIQKIYLRLISWILKIIYKFIKKTYWNLMIILFVKIVSKINKLSYSYNKR